MDLCPIFKVDFIKVYVIDSKIYAFELYSSSEFS